MLGIEVQDPALGSAGATAVFLAGSLAFALSWLVRFELQTGNMTRKPTLSVPLSFSFHAFSVTPMALSVSQLLQSW